MEQSNVTDVEAEVSYNENPEIYPGGIEKLFSMLTHAVSARVCVATSEIREQGSRPISKISKSNGMNVCD